MHQDYFQATFSFKPSIRHRDIKSSAASSRSSSPFVSSLAICQNLSRSVTSLSSEDGKTLNDPLSSPIDIQVNKLITRMCRNRLDPNDTRHGWNHIDMSFQTRKAKEIIREHVEAKHIVTTGWMASGVKGHHHYHIYWKERKK